MTKEPEAIVDMSEFAKTIRPEYLQAEVESTLAIALIQPVGRAPKGAAPLPSIAIDEGQSESHSRVQQPSDLQVTRRLGAGGMGTVDLAKQQSLQREVAIKRLHPNLTLAQHARALLHEGVVMGRLEHPGIVPVHALGVGSDGSPVLVMKRVDGVSWSTLAQDPSTPLWTKLRADGRDAIEIHLEILSQVCNALSFAHAHGVVHRDVKPDNVMIGEFGEVYLLDWGIALDRSGLTPESGAVRQMTGTPCFMAPELFDGPLSAHDARTDVYLLGATLHNILTGTPRHDGDSLQALLLSSHFSRPVVYDESVSQELGALCNAATSAAPSDRPASVEAFRLQISRFLSHRDSVALAQSAASALEKVRQQPAQERASLDARRWITEAHFGYAQALKLWPDNNLALDGLRSCLELTAERELALRHPEAVHAILAELSEPHTELDAKLKSLEQELAVEHKRAELAELHEREMDRSQSAKSRAGLALVGLGFLFGMDVIQRMGAQRGGVLTVGQVLQTDLLMVGGFCAAVLVARRRLLGNRISQQLTFTLGAMIFGGVFADLLGWIAQTTVLLAAIFKFAIAGFALLVGAFTVDRPLIFPGILILAGALAMARWPASASVVGSLISLIVVLLFLWIPLRKQTTT